MKISVVSPVYMAENIIEELVKRLSDELKLLTSDFEIILVDDCGPDDSWNEIQKQCKLNSYVKGIKLSRNFGQHNAVSAGLEFAKGNIIVLMDCDLQDDPRHIKTLLEYYEKGNEIVFTKRIARKHNFFKNVSAKIYNAIFNILSDKNFDLKVGSLVIFSEKVKNEYINLKEHDKLYIQGLKWLGFKHTYVSVEHRERHSGASSYTLPKLINIAIQGWVSNSEKLLHLSIKIGFFFAFTSIIIVGYIIYNSFSSGYAVGWPSLISIILLSTGMVLICLGILGVYIGKIFKETQNRPLFIIKDKINLNE